MNKIELNTLGADPEVFLLDSNNIPMSAIGLVGGTKSEPRKLTDMGHYVQEDNVLVEFNIPPCMDAETMCREIAVATSEIKKIIPSGTSLGVFSSYEMDKKYLYHPKALEFGCEPDFNAWELCDNIPPEPTTSLRTAGGHIHVGYNDPETMKTVNIARAMDIFLGVPSILMDKDVQRRTMYGKAGCFREKSYGMEYRTLSNFWIASDELIHWAYNNTVKAIDFLNKVGELNEEEYKEVRDCIDNSDTDLALKLVKKYKLEVIEIPEKVLV